MGNTENRSTDELGQEPDGTLKVLLCCLENWPEKSKYGFKTSCLSSRGLPNCLFDLDYVVNRFADELWQETDGTLKVFACMENWLEKSKYGFKTSCLSFRVSQTASAAWKPSRTVVQTNFGKKLMELQRYCLTAWKLA